MKSSGGRFVNIQVECGVLGYRCWWAGGKLWQSVSGTSVFSVRQEIRGAPEREDVQGGARGRFSRDPLEVRKWTIGMCV